jgi:hypothetical protein
MPVIIQAEPPCDATECSLKKIPRQSLVFCRCLATYRFKNSDFREPTLPTQLNLNFDHHNVTFS